jgi:hypothetical protein
MLYSYKVSLGTPLSYIPQWHFFVLNTKLEPDLSYVMQYDHKCKEIKLEIVCLNI